jgi:hypothetical protein
MKWHEKVDLEALFGKGVTIETLESSTGLDEDGNLCLTQPPPSLMAPASPLNPPGPTLLAPRPGPMSVGPVLPPKPLPTKRLRRTQNRKEPRKGT